jgi:hypothetical protein
MSTPGIYEAFETDTDAEKDGQWVTGIREGMDVLVARFGNERYRKSFQRRIKPYRQQFDRDALPEEKLIEITVEAMADGILLNWRGDGFVDRSGEAMSYTREAAVTLLNDLPEFRDEVLGISREFETFRKHVDEEAAKN